MDELPNSSSKCLLHLTLLVQSWNDSPLSQMCLRGAIIETMMIVLCVGCSSKDCEPLKTELVGDLQESYMGSTVGRVSLQRLSHSAFP